MHESAYSGSALMITWRQLLLTYCAACKIRTSIKSLFPKRDCFALVRPMEDEQQLARLETVAISQLRPQFQKVHMPSSLLSVLSEVPPYCSSSSEFFYMQRTSEAAQLASSPFHMLFLLVMSTNALPPSKALGLAS